MAAPSAITPKIMEIKSLYVPPGGGVYETGLLDAAPDESIAGKLKFWKRAGWTSFALAVAAGATGKGIETFTSRNYDEILSGGPAGGGGPVVGKLAGLMATMGACHVAVALFMMLLMVSLMRWATLRKAA